MTDAPKTRDVTLSPEMALRVDAACDRFEAAWRAKRPLTIEEVVGDTPEPERSALLRHLILLDVEYRRRAGEAPRAEDYQQWYSLLGLGWFAREFEGAAASPALRYRLADELGHGGMGSVLRGYDPHMGRELAVKVLLENHRGHTQLVQRFLEEARIGARLQHPGIVPVYDRGEFPDRRPFFTMKLVKGQTLDDLLKERTQPDQDQARFLGIFEQIAQTMAYAHANGVIHRDLKPANVMVGAFGEVQVMDWGLAKVLAAEQRAGAESQGPLLGATPAAEPDTGPKLETERGLAMGTYQYMPPEQARGEIDRIDQRSDVFGLGAILCEILTGRPPFTGKTREELSARAMACDHAEAFAALDHSGADADLVQLTKRCLAAERHERPRNAGEAASAMTAYLTSVAERKRAAELAAAKATARAASERKARRLTFVAATVVLLAVLGGGGALWQWQVRRTEMRSDVAAHIRQIEEDFKKHRWQDVATSLSRAHGRLGNSKEPDLQRRLDAFEKDLRVVKRLEVIRVNRVHRESFETALTQANFEAEYRKLFQEEYQIDLESDEPVTVAERLGDSPIKVQIAAAVDFWAFSKRQFHDDRDKRLFAVARALDADEDRDALRRALIENDTGMVERTFSVMDRDRQPPDTLLLLSGALLQSDSPAKALAVMEQAVRLYPADLWINHWFGKLLLEREPERIGEAISCLRVVVALSPESPGSHVDFATALYNAGEIEQAESEFEAALKLNPRFAEAHVGLGYLFKRQKKVQKAVEAFRTAVEINPESALTRNGLGQALELLGDETNALDEYRKTVEYDPKCSPAWFNLGLLLVKQKKVAEAEDAFHASIKAEPNAGAPYQALGGLYYQRGDQKAAEAALREAIKRPGHYNGVYVQLSELYQHQGRLREATAVLETLVRVEPQDPAAHLDLAIVLRQQYKLAEANTVCRRALLLNPDSAVNLLTLGRILADERKFNEAEHYFREALVRDRDFTEAYHELGRSLLEQGRFQDALGSFKKAQELAAKFGKGTDYSAVWISDTETMIKLEKKLPEFLSRKIGVQDIDELVMLAELCRIKQMNYPAALMYAHLFKHVPASLANPRRNPRYTASCIAVMAGCGIGQNLDDTDAKTRSELRQQALTWLRSELEVWNKFAGSDKAADRALAEQTMRKWLSDPRLAPVRDPDCIVRPPAAELEAWRHVWTEVEAVLAKINAKEK